jgi:hypothetical protein
MDDLVRKERSETPVAATEADRRTHRRVGTLWSATVKMSRGAFDGMVLNVSLGGAKLMLAAPLCLEPTVTLTIDQVGTFRADVVWQRHEFAGLRFTDKPDYIARTLRDILPA